MPIPLVGSAASPVSYGDLVTGNSSNFKTGVGNWTTGTGTITFDSTIAYMWPSNNTGSAKWTTTLAGGGACQLSVPGTFRVGIEYVALLVLTVEEDADFPMSVRLGNTAASDTSTAVIPSFGSGESFNGGRFTAFVVRWRPTATRSSAQIQIIRTGPSNETRNLHISYCKLTRSEVQNANDLLLIGHPETSAAAPKSGFALTVDNGSQSARLSAGGKTNGGIEFHQFGATQIMSNTGGSGIYAADAVSGLYVDSASGDQNDQGFDVQVGPDSLGYIVGQKDATTIQLYPDASGHDIELADRGSNTWRNRAGDGGIAVPSKGMLPAYASDPSSPTERQSYWNTATKQIRIYNGTGWEDVASGSVVPINWLGAWNSATAYVEGDGVDHQGSSYVATASTTNDEPPAAPWQLVAAAGTDGADGADGEGVPIGGTTGQVLTKASATDFDTAWETPTGGGGPNISRTVSVVNSDCFFWDTTDVYDGGIGASVGGTGAAVSEGDAFEGHPGVIKLGTGTTSSGRATLMSGAPILLGGMTTRFGTIFKLDQLSDGTNRFMVRMGLDVADNQSDNALSVSFRYTDISSSGNWEASVRDSPAVTTLDLGVAADTNWHCFEFEINSSTSSIDFLIDGALGGTVTTSIPSPSTDQLYYAPVYISKSQGTTLMTCQIDAYWYIHTFNTSR